MTAYLRLQKSQATLLLAVLVVTLPLGGCKKTPIAEGYRVVGYDAATKQWTIMRNGTFDGRYLTKKLVVICTIFKWGDREADLGPDACHLNVGHLIIPNPLPGPDHARDFLLVDELPSETLSITEGTGPDRTMQKFHILKYEVLTDEPAK